MIIANDTLIFKSIIDSVVKKIVQIFRRCDNLQYFQREKCLHFFTRSICSKNKDHQTEPRLVVVQILFREIATV